VDPTRFIAPSVGEVVRTPGRHGFYSFIPTPIPRSLTLDSQTVLSLSEADTALGRLAGAGRLLPNPHILVEPYITREAVASSRIEGTQASMADVFQAAAGGGTPADGTDVREVRNYIEAMNRGLARLAELPLCLRLIREIHGVLMRGVRGRERQPGEFRISPNWIGSPNDRPDTAIFVPPPPDHLADALADLETFMNEDEMPLPPLIRCALLHYQFETIHPFLDGNGRIGRLLIVFYLVQKGRLPVPLLYTSSYFEQNRREYYERLQAVRERGELQEWLQFFLTGVALQATDAVARAEQLADLRERYRRGLTSSRSRAHEVVDLMLTNPVITVRRVQQALEVTQPGAQNLVNALGERGWLQELEFRGPGGRRYWIAPEVADILEPAEERETTADIEREVTLP
jgi:Fic family protein